MTSGPRQGFFESSSSAVIFNRASRSFPSMSLLPLPYCKLRAQTTSARRAISIEDGTNIRLFRVKPRLSGRIVPPQSSTALRSGPQPFRSRRSAGGKRDGGPRRCRRMAPLAYRPAPKYGALQAISSGDRIEFRIFSWTPSTSRAPPG
jgi:hypothetical protein